MSRSACAGFIKNPPPSPVNTSAGESLISNPDFTETNIPNENLPAASSHILPHANRATLLNFPFAANMTLYPLGESSLYKKSAESDILPEASSKYAFLTTSVVFSASLPTAGVV